MNCKPGDLLFIPFPYSDLKSHKKRPVLALTAPDKHGDFIALAVTSVPTMEHALRIDNHALAEGQLPKESWIRFDKIFTLHQSSIVKTLGALVPTAIEAVLHGLCQRVGYAKPKTGGG